MNLLFKSLGLLICGLVALRSLVYLFRAISQFLAERQLHRLRISLLREEIDAVRAERQTQSKKVAGWDGWRKFRVADKRQECPGCCSFYLVPHDGQPLPEFQPGQYLTFQLNVPGRDKKVVRCYSLSDRFYEDHYRVTIKKVLPPPSAAAATPGVSSSYFHDVVQPGSILDVSAPRGHFVLDRETDIPVVLLAGGVGITPMMCMARTLLAEGSSRRVHLFAGFSNSKSHLFQDELGQMAAEYANFALTVCYSHPTVTDEQAVNYHVGGRIDLPLLKAELPSSNGDFYLCGPGLFMQSLTQRLKEWGVPSERIHTEAFGPSSLNRTSRPMAVRVPLAAGGGGGPRELDFEPSAFAVRFDRSNAECAWQSNYDSLLDFADANGILIESGCRTGNCGTCLTAVKSGKVTYADESGVACEAGTCLPCICVPAGELVLDA